MAPESPHTQPSPLTSACGPPDAPETAPGAFVPSGWGASCVPPETHLTLTPPVLPHPSHRSVAQREPAKGPTPMKERKAHGQGRPVPSLEGLGLVGRPLPQQLCVLQVAWERAEGHRAVLPRGRTPDADWGIWGGLGSRGRAEKGLPGGRGPETQCSGRPTGGLRQRRVSGKAAGGVTIGLSPSEGQKTLSPPLAPGQKPVGLRPQLPGLTKDPRELVGLRQLVGFFRQPPPQGPHCPRDSGGVGALPEKSDHERLFGARRPSPQQTGQARIHAAP